MEGLTDELHLPNTTGPKLDVIVHALALHLAGDHRLHLAQGFKRTEVHILAIDKGLEARHQFRPSGQIARHHPCLDHRVAFPLTPMHLVIVFHRIEAQRQRAAFTKGAQAHVDTKHKAVGILGIQATDQGLTQLDEELLITDGATSIPGFTILGVDKDQIHIGGVVKLMGAQLAHTQYHQPLCMAVTVMGASPLLGQPVVQSFLCLVDTGIGQRREIGRCRHHVRVARQITPGDTHHLAPTQLAQGLTQRGLIAASGDRLLHPSTMLPLIIGPPQIATGEKFLKQFAIT